MYVHIHRYGHVKKDFFISDSYMVRCKYFLHRPCKKSSFYVKQSDWLKSVVFWGVIIWARPPKKRDQEGRQPLPSSMSTVDNAFHPPLPMSPSSPITAATHRCPCCWAAFLDRQVAGASATLLGYWWHSVGVGVSLGRQQLCVGLASAAGAERWRVDGAMTISGCWPWRAAVGGGGKMQQWKLGGRWEGGTWQWGEAWWLCEGGGRWRHPADHRASADHWGHDDGHCCLAWRSLRQWQRQQ